MNYRKLGKKGFKVSSLGLGAMRLPVINNETKNIDENHATRMYHYAIDNGINYIDTAYPYHDGMSEVITGKILKQGGYRNKVKLATKQPSWLIEKYEDFDKYLDEQLTKLQTDHIDFYLLHALFSERWEKIYNLNVLEWSEKAINSGKIGEFGFSFHDSFDIFKGILDLYDKWSFCQIQYNYLNENVQAGKKGLEYAASKNISVIVMEPLMGGILANPPGLLGSIIKDKNMNPVDLALRWLWNQKDISLVLSGASNIEQLKQNIESENNSGIDALNESEKEVIGLLKNKYMEYRQIPCTKCNYCAPCPYNVNIPRNFEIYNESVFQIDLSKSLYNWHLPDKFKAAACIGCKICEDKCPQKIKISELMPELHKKLVFIT